jgi:hypothetical protein
MMTTEDMILRQLDNLISIKGELEIKTLENGCIAFGKQFCVTIDARRYHASFRLYFRQGSHWCLVFFPSYSLSQQEALIKYNGTLKECFDRMRKYLKVSSVLFSQV